MLASIVPCLPGLANNVNPDVSIGGAIYIAQFNWYYGFVVSFAVYAVLSLLWPARESLVPCMIESVVQAEEEQIDMEKNEGIVTTTTTAEKE